MAYDLVVKGGVLLTPKGRVRADIGVRGEKVAALAPRLESRGGATVDAKGCFVLPGGVDAHTHFDLPYRGTTTADDFSTGTLAAAMGGTTTVIDFATQERGGSMLDALDAWHGKANGKSFTDYGFHMAVTDLPGSRLGELDEVAAEGCPSFKFYMAYPGVLMLDDRHIFRGMLRLRELGALAMVHAENGGLIAELVERARAEGKTSPRWHARTRPMAAEGEAAHRAVALAEAAGCPLYVVHVTCGAAMDEIRRARARGAKVYGETCPQYLYLDDRLYGRPGFEGAKFVMSPPLRPAAQKKLLWEGLRRGWLQTVATDHCSFNYGTGRGASKRLGRRDFSLIPNGAPGVEQRLLLMWDAVAGGTLSAERFVELVAEAPARLHGLYPRKGCLKPGSDADIVVLDPRRRHRFAAKTHFANVDYEPYEGRSVRGAVRDVFLRGRRLVEAFKPAGAPPSGVFLKRRAVH